MIVPLAEGIRILVADDEEPARQRLIDLLQTDAQVEAVLEAADGHTAVEIIEREALILSSSMCRCLSSMAWK